MYFVDCRYERKTKVKKIGFVLSESMFGKVHGVLWLLGSRVRVRVRVSVRVSVVSITMCNICGAVCLYCEVCC